MLKVFTCKGSPGSLHFVQQGGRQSRTAAKSCRNENCKFSPVGLSHGHNCTGLTIGHPEREERIAAASYFAEPAADDRGRAGFYIGSTQGLARTNHCSSAVF